MGGNRNRRAGLAGAEGPEETGQTRNGLSRGSLL